MRALDRGDLAAAVHGFKQEAMQQHPHALEAVQALAKIQEPHALEALVDLLDTPNSRWTNEEWRTVLAREIKERTRMFADNPDYDPRADPVLRGRQKQAWQDWLRRNRERVAPTSRGS